MRKMAGRLRAGIAVAAAILVIIGSVEAAWAVEGVPEGEAAPAVSESAEPGEGAGTEPPAGSDSEQAKDEETSGKSEEDQTKNPEPEQSGKTDSEQTKGADTKGSDTKKAVKKKRSNKKPHILIVDQNTKDYRRVAKMMRACGFKVSRAYSVKKANPAKYDGLVIPGGHNITPSVYGAKRSKYTYGTNLKKDRIQIKAIKKFAKAGKPVLGVCRGCQVVNVAFGGTIKQHISWHRHYRKIKIKKGSWLYDLYGKTEPVFHSHHQCVKKLGKGLVATQWDAKVGNIEGIEHKTLPVYGIQWHPDHMGKKGRKVFKEFKKVCQEYMAA